MTIAACYINPEGIVLGADSTASIYFDPHGFHYLNHNQKIFEIGTDSTLGIVTWGLASINQFSHRTQIAMLSDDLAARPTNSMKEIAERFAQQVHAAYSTAFTSELARCQQLASLKPFVAGANDSADRRTEAEEKEYNNLTVGLSLGFCIGGYLLPERKPQAFSIHFNPAKSGLPEVVSVGATSSFWGAQKYL